jgi:hypothetical protein
MSVREGWVEEMHERQEAGRGSGLAAGVDALGAGELVVTIVFALAVAAATLALVLSSA